MKKFIYLAASLSIVFGCAEKINEPECMHVPDDAFVLTVEAPSTKTVFDGKDYSVEWESEDILGVYITAEGSGTPVYYTFAKGEGNQFWSEDFKPEANVAYTYTVVYPCPENSEPADGKVNISIVSGTQSGADNSSHIQTPLYGSSSVLAGESPKIVLKHLATIIRVNVTNSTAAESVSVQEVSVETKGDGGVSAAVAGAFSLDLETGEISAVESSSSEASVTVESGTVESSATFYVLMAPYKGDLDINVKADDRNYIMTKTGLDFEAGFVYSTNVACADFWLDGSALPAGVNAALTKTVEDANVYAWYADLKAGSLSIVNQDGKIKPTDGTFGKTSAYSAGDYVYNISSAGKYRVVVNTETQEVTVYDPATDLKPFSVTWYKEGNTNTKGYTTTVIDKLYLHGAGSSWAAKEITFTPSVADPQVLVYDIEYASGISPDLRIRGGRNKFAIDANVTFDPGDGSGEKTFSMSDWFLGSGTQAPDGQEVPLNESLTGWTQMYGGYDQRECYWNMKVWADLIIVDLRNMRIRIAERWND